MVRQGYAWVYRKYASDPERFELEPESREARRGHWATDGPIPPWDWRRGRRAVERNAEAVKGMIVANRRSKVYHLPGFPGYDQVSTKNRVLFVSREAVEA